MKKIVALIMILCFSTYAGALSEGTEDREIRLTRFWYTFGGYMVPQSYEVFLLGNEYYLCLNETPACRIKPETAEALMRIVEKYDIAGWNGFHGNDPYILDGEDFGLSVSLSDGTEIFASGSNAFPDHYHDATSEIITLLEEADPGGRREATGIYRYEGEGFGGDFTITIARDGTYTFYEGPLSSYMGGGEWSVSGSRMDMYEENGFNLYFTMIVTEDALVYVKGESDEFPYIQVPDGGRFLRDETAEYGKTFRLTLESFDGGGPFYRVEIEDYDTLTFFADCQYRDENHEEIDGAAYEIYYDFAGKKPGTTRVIIHSESPIAGNEDIVYMAAVDENLNVIMERAEEDDSSLPPE